MVTEEVAEIVFFDAVECKASAVAVVLVVAVAVAVKPEVAAWLVLPVVFAGVEELTIVVKVVEDIQVWNNDVVVAVVV